MVVVVGVGWCGGVGHTGGVISYLHDHCPVVIQRDYLGRTRERRCMTITMTIHVSMTMIIHVSMSPYSSGSSSRSGGSTSASAREDISVSCHGIADKEGYSCVDTQQRRPWRVQFRLSDGGRKICTVVGPP